SVFGRSDRTKKFRIAVRNAGPHRKSPISIDGSPGQCLSPSPPPQGNRLGRVRRRTHTRLHFAKLPHHQHRQAKANEKTCALAPRNERKTGTPFFSFPNSVWGNAGSGNSVSHVA